MSAWLVYPQTIVAFQAPLSIACAAQLLLFAVNLGKFRKLPSFHTYTAKIWGLTLLVATVSLFGFDYSPTLWLPIVLCLVNSLEEIVMTLILPEWHCDVLSILHALELRKNPLGESPDPID